MRIAYRAEIEQDALTGLNEVSLATENALAQILEDSCLNGLDLVVRYVPIIMGEETRRRYPARSRLDRKNHAFNCSPQLPFEPFVTGTSAERFTVYINGMRESGPALAKLGATTDQVKAFGTALDEALARLVPDQIGKANSP